MIISGRAVIAGTMLCLAGVAGACGKELSPEEQTVVSDLRADLARARGDIVSAEEENAKYSGGLIKALISVRLEILKTNAALIEQRIHAIEAGVQPTVVVPGSAADPARASELATEIVAQQA